MFGKIYPNPGPVSVSTAGKINCLVINARIQSLKIYHKAAQQTGNPCVTSFASRTWCAPKTLTIYASMRQNISNSEILHSGFTIFRRDRSDRGGGGVLIAIKTASFKAVKEFKPESEVELQQLEIIWLKLLSLLVKELYSVFAMGHPMKTQVGWMYSIIFCMKFVTSSTKW